MFIILALLIPLALFGNDMQKTKHGWQYRPRMGNGRYCTKKFGVIKNLVTTGIFWVIFLVIISVG